MKNYILNKQDKGQQSQLKDQRIIKVAQDVHARSIVSCLQEEGQQPKAPRRADPDLHLKRMEELVKRFQKVNSCYEAGPTGFSLHRTLTQMGVENVVVAPIRLDERGKRVNNDRSDTLALAGRLDRYVAGNKRIFSVVRVPKIEEENRRTWSRQCQQLGQQKQSMASQGRSLALTRGFVIEQDWWQPRRWKMWQPQLGEALVEHLEIWRRLIVAVQETLTAIEAKIVAQCKARKEARPKWAGELSLERIESEVCSWDRFGAWRKAGGYTGLAGGVSSSGEYHRDLSITKMGNRRLRTELIEMAWRMSRGQPGYWLSKKWAPILDRKAKASRGLRKKAIVAYARELFVDLWKWKTGRTTPEKLGWEMILPEA